MSMTANRDPKLVTDAEWKKKLTPMQYYVCRQKGTEAPDSGEYYNHFEEGSYLCVCCEAILFSSKTKYRSRCGWPSFWTGVDGAVAFDELNGAHGSEILCKRCGSHLGHIFDDGPPPTGKRY